MSRIHTAARPIPDQWVPCLILEGDPLPDGMTTSYTVHLPMLFGTPGEAMAAARHAALERPDALGFTVYCMNQGAELLALAAEMPDAMQGGLQ